MQALLSACDKRLVKTGGAAAWPWSMRTTENEMRLPLQKVATALDILMGDRHIIRQYYLRISVKVHTSRYETSGFRTYYTALACTDMVSQCYDVTTGSTVIAIWAMT